MSEFVFFSAALQLRVTEVRLFQNTVRMKSDIAAIPWYQNEKWLENTWWTKYVSFN